jgi:hypothetical protein
MTQATIYKLEAQFADLQAMLKSFRNVWAREILFTWQWWLLLALTVLPWVCWAFYRKKDSTNRLLFAGFFSIIIAKLLDSIGSSFGLWMYTARVVPLTPPFFPWDTTLMPVAVMTFIQFKPKIHPAIKAAVFAAVSAFAVEPLAVWLKLYEPLTWRHIYSLPIYFAIYLAAHWLSKRESFGRVQG